MLRSTQALAKDGELSPELKRKASILGWCIEWVRPASAYVLLLFVGDIQTNTLM